MFGYLGDDGVALGYLGDDGGVFSSLGDDGDLFGCLGDDGAVQAADEALSQRLVQDLLRGTSPDMLTAFVRCFLLDSNVASVRWHTHRIMHQIFL